MTTQSRRSFIFKSIAIACLPSTLVANTKSIEKETTNIFVYDSCGCYVKEVTGTLLSNQTAEITMAKWINYIKNLNEKVTIVT